MTHPPRFARTLLSLLLWGAQSGLVLDELDDLFELRCQRKGLRFAQRWYWKQVLSFPARLLGAWSIRAIRTLAQPEMWRKAMSFDALARDLKYAVRRLALAPGFSAIAILSLALGIGANTAMFSIVNAVLLADPPFADSEELVELYTSDSGGTLYGTWSYPDYEDLVAQSGGIFEEASLARTFVAASGSSDRPEVVMGESVSVNSFSMHGIAPVLGRTFDEQDNGGSGASPVVILNYRTWAQRYGKDPGVIGTDFRINQLNYTVVGVMPEWFTGSFPAFHSAAWVPANMTQSIMASTTDPNERRGSRSSFVRARLSAGVSIEQANDWLASFGSGIAEANPETNLNRVYTAVPLDDILVHPIVDKALLPVAGLLMGMVGLVLLIACANLASFLLARAEQRRKEIAVRLSLGAGRLSLVRQLLVETTLLALIGGAGGILVARWAVSALVAVRPPIPIPLNLTFPLDGTVLLFTLGASIVAGTVFGLIPAAQATKPDVAQTLGEEAGSVSKGSRTRHALVIAQVALSLVLLVSSGLFLRSMINAQDADPGFYTGAAAIVWPHLNLTGLTDEEAKVFWTTFENRLNATPGITGVAATDNLPLGFGVQTRSIEIPGIPGPTTEGLHSIDYAHVSPSYFEVMEVPLIGGRVFTKDDVEGGENVAVVSRAFEGALFPEGAVGRTYLESSNPVRIIGVVADSKVRTIGEAPRPRIYSSTTQTHLDGLQFIVRGAGTSGALLSQTVAVALDIEPDLVLFDQRTMEEQLAVHLFPPRMAALLLSIFGGLALLLAAVGIFGVVSHAVARRTREVGIRVALGASGRDVIQLLVGGGMRVVGIGVALGLVLAIAAGQVVGRFLYDVGGLDPLTFFGIPLVLVGVAFMAVWIPAQRAARIDPVEALYSE